MTNHDDETRRKEIIEMAREAGFHNWYSDPSREYHFGCVVKFAELVAAAEREECAVLCESRHENGNYKYDHMDECAQAIREKGETK